MRKSINRHRSALQSQARDNRRQANFFRHHRRNQHRNIQQIRQQNSMLWAKFRIIISTKKHPKNTQNIKRHQISQYAIPAIAQLKNIHQNESVRQIHRQNSQHFRKIKHANFVKSCVLPEFRPSKYRKNLFKHKQYYICKIVNCQIFFCLTIDFLARMCYYKTIDEQK